MNSSTDSEKISNATISDENFNENDFCAEQYVTTEFNDLDNGNAILTEARKIFQIPDYLKSNTFYGIEVLQGNFSFGPDISKKEVKKTLEQILLHKTYQCRLSYKECVLNNGKKKKTPEYYRIYASCLDYRYTNFKGCNTEFKIIIAQSTEPYGLAQVYVFANSRTAIRCRHETIDGSSKRKMKKLKADFKSKEIKSDVKIKEEKINFDLPVKQETNEQIDLHTVKQENYKIDCIIPDDKEIKQEDYVDDSLDANEELLAGRSKFLIPPNQNCKSTYLGVDIIKTDKITSESFEDRKLLRTLLYSVFVEHKITCEVTFGPVEPHIVKVKKGEEEITLLDQSYIRCRRAWCKHLNVKACDNQFYFVVTDLHMHFKSVYVYSTTWDLHKDHATLGKPRQARHYHRDELKKELKHSCPAKVAFNQLDSRDKALELAGNRDKTNMKAQITSDQNLAKIKSEDKYSHRLHNCFQIDLTIRLNDPKSSVVFTYFTDMNIKVTKTTTQPTKEFCVLLIHLAFARLVYEYQLMFEICHGDATGGLVANLVCKYDGNEHEHNQSRILNYIFVVKYKGHSFVAFEFIASAHKTSDMVRPLTYVRDYFKHNIGYVPFRSFVTDICNAQIHALIHVFLQKSYEEYLNDLYEGKVDLNLPIIIICCVHLAHRVAIRTKHIENAMLRAFIMEVFCLLINAETRENVEEIVLFSTFLTTSRTITKTVRERSKNFNDKYITETTKHSQQNIQEQVEHLNKNQPPANEDDFDDLFESRQNTNKKSRRFEIRAYVELEKKINKEMAEGKKQDGGDEINDLYDENSELIKLFRAYLFNYLMWSKCGYIEISNKRVSNMPIERYNKTLKHEFFDTTKSHPIFEYIRETQKRSERLCETVKDEYLSQTIFPKKAPQNNKVDTSDVIQEKEKDTKKKFSYFDKKNLKNLTKRLVTQDGEEIELEEQKIKKSQARQKKLSKVDDKPIGKPKKSQAKQKIVSKIELKPIDNPEEFVEDILSPIGHFEGYAKSTGTISPSVKIEKIHKKKERQESVLKKLNQIIKKKAENDNTHIEKIDDTIEIYDSSNNNESFDDTQLSRFDVYENGVLVNRDLWDTYYFPSTPFVRIIDKMQCKVDIIEYADYCSLKNPRTKMTVEMINYGLICIKNEYMALNESVLLEVVPVYKAEVLFKLTNSAILNERPLPPPEIDETDKNILKNSDMFISVIYLNSANPFKDKPDHFFPLIVDSKNKTLYVFNSLKSFNRRRNNKVTTHILNEWLTARKNLLNINEKEGLWSVYFPTNYMWQQDSYSCGPLSLHYIRSFLQDRHSITSLEKPKSEYYTEYEVDQIRTDLSEMILMNSSGVLETCYYCNLEFIETEKNDIEKCEICSSTYHLSCATMFLKEDRKKAGFAQNIICLKCLCYLNRTKHKPNVLVSAKKEVNITC